MLPSQKSCCQHRQLWAVAALAVSDACALGVGDTGLCLVDSIKHQPSPHPTPCVVVWWLQARKDAAQFAATQLETLSDKTKTPTSQLKFIMDAWAQVRGRGTGVDRAAEV